MSYNRHQTFLDMYGFDGERQEQRPSIIAEEQELKGRIAEVEEIYNKDPITIQSDTLLLFRYLEYFHNITRSTNMKFIVEYMLKNGITQASLSRAGRKLREDFPEMYQRDKKKTKRMEEIYKSVFKEPLV